MNALDKKIFGTLFFAIFATVTGVGLVVPLLPVYAHDLGAKGIYIGLIFGAFSISRTVFLPYFGRRSDIHGRKPYIVAGLLAYTLISFIFIFAKDVTTLIIIRLFQGVASAMIMPVIQAYVGDITPPDTEGYTMGVFNLSVFFGLSIGPLLGGVINDAYGLDFSFICMGGLSFFGFLLAFFLLPPVRSEKTASRETAPTPLKRLASDREVLGLFFFRFTYTACIGIIWGFLPVFADTEFSLTSSSIGVLIILGVLVSGVMQTPMGYAADRFNRRLMVIAGGLVTCYAIFSFEWAGGFWDLFAANVIFGLGGGLSMAPLMAMAVSKGSRTDAMGSVMSLMTMAHSMGMMCGSLFAGLMMDMFRLRQAFLFGALIMVAGVVLFLGFTWPRKPPPDAVAPS